MTNELNFEDLEKSLLNRAKSLAAEYAERTRLTNEQFIRDENERLRLREEREILAAKLKADQFFRSLVQIEELKTLEKIDKLRWSLMKKVLDDAYKELLKLTNNKEDYLALLKKLLKQSLNFIPSTRVIVEFRKEDQQFIASNWEDITLSLNTIKKIYLSDKYCISKGGFIIYDEHRKIRINNTFEGRIQYLYKEINQVIAELLFSEVKPVRSTIHDR